MPSYMYGCLLDVRLHAAIYTVYCNMKLHVPIQACHTPVWCYQRCFSTWTPTPGRRRWNWNATRPQSLLHHSQLLCILVEVLRLVLEGMMHLQPNGTESQHTSADLVWDPSGMMHAPLLWRGRTCVSTRTSSARSVLGYTSSRSSAFRCHSSRALCIAACLLLINRFCSFRNSDACLFITCSL